MPIQWRDKTQCQYDMIALGEIMLRLDPGEGRIRCTVNSRFGKAAANTTSPVACAGVSA
jgi:hypothetical protein